MASTPRQTRIEITHRPSPVFGWTFECAATPWISGGGRTLVESLETATESARQALEARQGRWLERRELEHRVRHVVLEATPDAAPAVGGRPRRGSRGRFARR